MHPTSPNSERRNFCTELINVCLGGHHQLFVEDSYHSLNLIRAIVTILSRVNQETARSNKPGDIFSSPYYGVPRTISSLVVAAADAATPAVIFKSLVAGP